MYKKGDRIKLVSTTDKFTNLKPGDLGTVRLVDGIGTVHIDWDNGSGLGMIPGEDVIELITDAEVSKSMDSEKEKLEERVAVIKASSNPRKEFFNQLNNILKGK